MFLGFTTLEVENMLTIEAGEGEIVHFLAISRTAIGAKGHMVSLWDLFYQAIEFVKWLRAACQATACILAYLVGQGQTA